MDALRTWVLICFLCKLKQTDEYCVMFEIAMMIHFMGFHRGFITFLTIKKINCKQQGKTILKS